MLLDLPLKPEQLRFLHNGLANMAEVSHELRAAFKLRMTERLVNRVNGVTVEESHRAIIEHQAILNAMEELFSEIDSTKLKPSGGNNVSHEYELTSDYISELHTYVGSTE